MKLFDQLSDGILPEERDGLRRIMLSDNLRRGRALAFVIIGFETCFVSIDIFTAVLKVDGRFHFSLYLGMYLLMIALSLLYLFYAKRYKDISILNSRQIGILEKHITAYITLLMCWGSVVSLMDQPLYGQLTVFMANMIACSVIYYQNHRQILLPYACSTVLLLVGLPLFQKSSDVLIGHYVNMLFFIFISWTASRIIYLRYCHDYNSKLKLTQANTLLQAEIGQNAEMNLKLAEANLQLKKLSLLDELTGIPNRRSFRNYIDMVFESQLKENMLFSVIMIDLDYFKELNDNYGHGQADLALCAVAKQIQSVVRHTGDFAARWGGEEFVYAAFGMNAKDTATVAETIRRKVLQLKIPHEFSKACSYVSVSLGLNTVEVKDRGDISHCIELADKAMYKAKADGRNRIGNL